MRYLIDGHNLIPKLGLSLRDIDDEEQLTNILQNYCRQMRHRAEIYFDNAPPGFSGARNRPPLVIHYVRAGRTADEAIRARLKRLGNDARNWTVVSSDRQVQAAARGARARVLSAEDFAARVRSGPPPSPQAEKPEPSAEEIDEWLALFNGKEE